MTASVSAAAAGSAAAGQLLAGPAPCPGYGSLSGPRRWSRRRAWPKR